MASATDIITYVGVPLAVIGVLPILWTAFKTLLFSYRLRKDLTQSLTSTGLRKHVVTNTDILSGKVDVTYERVRLWPLEENNEKSEIPRPETERSKLKGGSWTILQWDMIIFNNWEDVPAVRYTLTTADHLRQPAAIIEFPALVRYLLNLGAQPNAEGLRKLLAEEQRVVAGTVILKGPNGSVLPVLAVTNREDDDDADMLALRLNWAGIMSCHYTPRAEGNVPLNWWVIKTTLRAEKATRTKFIPPRPGGKIFSFPAATHGEGEINIYEKEEVRTPHLGRTWKAGAFGKYANGAAMIEMFEKDMKPAERGWDDILGDPGDDTDEERWTDPFRHAQSKQQRLERLERYKRTYATPTGYYEQEDIVDPALFTTDPALQQEDSEKRIALLFNDAGVQQGRCIYGDSWSDKASSISITHLEPNNQDRGIRPGDWLSFAAIALAVRRSNLTLYKVPNRLFVFAKDAYRIKPLIPCGVLVQLGLIPQEECTVWQPEDSWQIYIKESEEYRQKRFSSFGNTPSFGNTLGNNSSLGNSSHSRISDRDEPTQQDIINRVRANIVPYALASPAWPVAKIADLVLPWLQNEFGFSTSSGWNAPFIARWVVKRMILYPAEAAEIAGMLTKWQMWAERNAVGEDGYKTIKGHRTTFTLCACLLAIMGAYEPPKDADVLDVLERVMGRWGDVLLN
ncbi:hypothetical protein MMC25_002243 [Agyrium rufum]|nr:hypothetical protein [Agyrium rufum]